jgi:hypothetical protein
MTDRGKLSPEGQRAVELFQEQLAAMPAVRNFRGSTPEFSQWKDSTRALFTKYLLRSPYYNRFFIIQFESVHETKKCFLRACDLAEQCIRGAIQDIERLDVKPTGHR